MALSIDAIRNFAGTDRILVGQQGVLQSVDKGQRFRSFFNIGDARQRNSETLAAIHQAIVNDPRYFARDVQQEAVRLLSQVRTDRAIGAAEIKSIIDRLDNMSLPGQRRAAAQNIVTARLAARGRPDFLPQGMEAGYARLAREEIAIHEPAVGGFGHMDFDAALDAFETKMRNLFTRLGDGAGDAEVLARICGKGMRGVGGGLKSQASLDAFVDDLKANLDESRALGAQYGEEARLDVVDMLLDMEKPITPTAAVPNPMRTLVEIGRSLPQARLANLNARSSASEINAAVREFVQALTTTPTGLSITDAGEVMAAQGLMAKSAVTTWPDDVKANVLAALESDAGKNLQAFYKSEGLSREASNCTFTLDLIATKLKAALGRPDPQMPIPVPVEPDATQLPPHVMSQFSLSATATGTGAGPIKAFIAKIEDGGSANVAARQAKMAATCQAMVVTSITQQIYAGLFNVRTAEDGKTVLRTFNPDKTGTQFDKDLLRGMPMRLPSGAYLPEDPARARDELMKFITGDAHATFATATTAQKMEVNIIATCMNQSLAGIAMSAYGECLNDDPTSAYSKFSAVSNTKLERDEVFELSQESNGDVKLHFISRRPVKALTIEGNVEMLAPGSFDEYEMDITFPAGNLNALATTDWSKYDHVPVNAADKNSKDMSRHITSANLVPDEFKFTGTVTMHPHVHYIAADPE